MRKKATTALVERYLDQFGWPNHQTIEEPGEQEGLVYTRWSYSLVRPPHTLQIDPIVEQDVMLFTVRDIATVPVDDTPSDRLGELLLAIAAVNTRLPLGAFVYDPADGEVLFRVGIPVAGGNLRFEDFARCMRAVVAEVERFDERFSGIIMGIKVAHDVIGKQKK